MTKRGRSNSNRMKVWVHGCEGKMGQALRSAIAEGQTFEFCGGSDKEFGEGSLFYGQKVTAEKLAQALEQADVVIDFSAPAGTKNLGEALIRMESTGKAILIGTTGLDHATVDRLTEATRFGKHRLLRAPNTSLGIITLVKTLPQLASVCSKHGFDVEIVETHHRAKKDAPSGTAKLLAETAQRVIAGSKIVTSRNGERQTAEIGVHALRGGGVFGEHVVRLMSADEEIFIGHRAFSRNLFSQGALVLAQWLAKQTARVYAFEEIALSDL